MRQILLTGFLGLSFFANAQYTSPGTGLTLKIQDIATADPESVSVSATNNLVYLIKKDITISANDQFVLDQDLDFLFADNVTFTVTGNINVNAPNKANFTVANTTTEKYRGFRIEEGSNAYFNNVNFSYGGGLQVLTATFTLENCEFTNIHSGAATSGVISFSRGNPIVRNSRFIKNENPAVGSSANGAVGITFENNYLEGNNTTNNNRPQVNMGPSGDGQKQYIRNNTIIGDRSLTRVGGIGSSSLVGVENYAVIEGNTVKDNRYGITIVGVNSGGEILGNILENNDSEGNPSLGGSGISISQTANSPLHQVKILNNQIRHHIWGITLIGNGTDIFMGDETTPGGNIFAENGNNNITYALYNNNANAVTAQGNCWIENQNSTETEVEDVIFHQTDDSSLGLVDYSNFGCNLATESVTKTSVEIYPNPVKDLLNVKSKNKISSVEIYHSNGQKVLQQEVKNQQLNLSQLTQGVYLLKINFIDGQTTTQKFIKK